MAQYEHANRALWTGGIRLDGQEKEQLLRGLGPVTPVRDQARVLPVDEQSGGAAAEEQFLHERFHKSNLLLDTI